MGRYHFWDSEERARRMQSAHATNRDPVFTVPKAREEWFTDTSQLENQDAVGEKKRKKVAGKRTCVYPSSFHDNAYWTDYPHGWPFHAHCWTIAEKVLGPKLEDNLELLIAAIRSKWEDEQLLNEAVRMAAWVRESSSEADEIRVWNSLVASSDPLAGRDVVELLCESHNQQQISSIDPRCSVATAGNGKHITTVPHDIQTMVLDCIHYTSVRVALAATGWHIDDTYWRGRMPRHIMWELNEVDHNAQIDWKYLCLKAEEMVDSSPGLLNRQRIRNLVMDIERRMEYQAIIGVDETIMDPAPVAEPDNDGVDPFEDDYFYYPEEGHLEEESLEW